LNKSLAVKHCAIKNSDVIAILRLQKCSFEQFPLVKQLVCLHIMT